MASLVDASPSRTSPASKLLILGTARNFLDATARPARPAALEQDGPLSGKVGAALDPCAALQTSIDLRPGARIEIVFFLGQTENKEEARELLHRYRAADLNKRPGRSHEAMG